MPFQTQKEENEPVSGAAGLGLTSVDVQRKSHGELRRPKKMQVPKSLIREQNKALRPGYLAMHAR